MADERILLAQLADIGDLVLTTPAMAALREARPRARIDLLASERALPIVPDGLVDGRIPFKRGAGSVSRDFYAWKNLRTLLSLRARRYDTLVYFHHFSLRAGVFKFWLLAKACGARRIIGLRNHNIGFLTDSVSDEGFGARHQAQYWLDLVKVLGASSRPRPAQVEREALPHDLLLPAGKPTVVLHAGSGGYSQARRWSPESFAAVGNRLKAEYDAEIVLVGQADDESQSVEELLREPAINLSGKTSLPQLAYVIAGADLYIGADSGVTHIAAATGAPVLSVFGPSNPAAWHPWQPGGKAIALRSGVECSPCSYIGHSIGARDGCLARTCMKLVRPEQVLEAARQALEAAGASMDAAGSKFASATSGKRDDRIEILGVAVDAISYDGWMSKIGKWVRSGDGARHVCTVNPEFIMIARQDPIFRVILNRADLCVPDGVGLLWASRYLGAPLRQRVTGSDGVPLIARHAAREGWKLFLLGAAEGIAERAAGALQDQHPRLIVAGVYGGSPAAAEEDEIVAMINASDADILLVAYGAPEQDKWIARNLPRLDAAMAMGVGGSLDFIAGVVPRAPKWMRDLGLEWLYRLLRQPWRLRRMLRLPRFVFAVLQQRRKMKSAARKQSESQRR